MAQGAYQDVPFEAAADGENRAWTLRFSVRAMAALQDHYKLASLEEVGERLSDTSKFQVGDMQAILWAGLQTYHRGLTMEQAMDVLDAIGLEKAGELIAKAFGAAVPPAKGRPSRPRKPGPSTG